VIKEAAGKISSVHKKRLQSGGRGLSSADIFQIRRMSSGIRTFWRKKFGFFKIYGSPHGQGWRGRTSADKEGGVLVFLDFVRAFFMDGS